MSANSFGARLRQARRELAAREGRDVGQADVAARVGVTKVTISRYESDVQEPSLAMIEKLAAALGVTPAYLAFGERPGAGPPPTTNGQPAEHFIPLEEAIARGLVPAPPPRAAAERPQPRRRRA